MNWKSIGNWLANILFNLFIFHFILFLIYVNRNYSFIVFSFITKCTKYVLTHHLHNSRSFFVILHFTHAMSMSIDELKEIFFNFLFLFFRFASINVRGFAFGKWGELADAYGSWFSFEVTTRHSAAWFTDCQRGCTGHHSARGEEGREKRKWVSTVALGQNE